MDYMTLFTTAFIVGLSGAMMPGPMLTVTITETPRQGFWVGPKIVLGHGIVESLLIACLAGGLTYYIQQPVVTGGISLVGGLVLLWFGWGIYISTKNKAVSLNFAATGISPTPITGPDSINPLLSGIILSLTNPYWSVWWSTVGVSYVVIAMNLGTAGLFTFFAGHILSDLFWFSFVSFIIHTGRHFISDSLYRGILLVCAAFLVLLGCWIAYEGFHQLFLLFR